jgi:hypothetical protein
VGGALINGRGGGSAFGAIGEMTLEQKSIYKTFGVIVGGLLFSIVGQSDLTMDRMSKRGINVIYFLA